MRGEVTIYLGARSRGNSNDLPAVDKDSDRISSLPPHPTLSLKGRGKDEGEKETPRFGLAPGEVFHTPDVAIREVRSYRTISPLPHSLRCARLCIFCGTVSPRCHYDSRRAPVRRHPVLWSPDFPPSTQFPGC